MLVSCIIALESNTFPNSCHLKLIVIVIAANTEIEGAEGGAVRGSLSDWKKHIFYPRLIFSPLSDSSKDILAGFQKGLTLIP